MEHTKERWLKEELYGAGTKLPFVLFTSRGTPVEHCTKEQSQTQTDVILLLREEKQKEDQKEEKPPQKRGRSKPPTQ